MPANKSKNNKFGSCYKLFILLSISLSFVNMLIYRVNSEGSVVYATSEQSDEYWESIIKNYPTYRDAYIVLASIHRGRGEVFEANKLILQAKEIDPYLVFEEL